MHSDFFRNKKILVTGGLGFIGSNLARALVNLGAKVTLIDNMQPLYGGNYFNISDVKDKLTVNISDVRDSNAFSHLVSGQDLLFNLAGQTSHIDSMNDPRTDLEINTLAQLSMLEACRNHNKDIKIIYASTRQIYGRPQFLPVDESHPIQPVDVNGINKQAGESYHLLYNQVYGIRSTVLRLTNTYGPGMRVKDARQTFVGIWLRNLIEDKPILVFGDGSQLRDFNYVDDVVNALLMAAVHDEVDGNVYNLGSAEIISLKALADMLIELNVAGTSVITPFPAERKAIDIGDYYGDHTKFSKLVGWQPKTSLRDGMQRSLNYFKLNSTHYWKTEQ